MKRTQQFYDYVNYLNLTIDEKETLIELAEIETKQANFHERKHTDRDFKLIEDHWIDWHDFDNKKLRALRNAQKHTMQSLAKALDLKYTRYEMIEKGLHRVRQSELTAICIYFDISETTLHYTNAGINGTD